MYLLKYIKNNIQQHKINNVFIKYNLYKNIYDSELNTDWNNIN